VTLDATGFADQVFESGRKRHMNVVGVQEIAVHEVLGDDTNGTMMVCGGEMEVRE
jgi:hypothetical protein